MAIHVTSSRCQAGGGRIRGGVARSEIAGWQWISCLASIACGTLKYRQLVLQACSTTTLAPVVYLPIYLQTNIQTRNQMMGCQQVHITHVSDRCTHRSYTSQMNEPQNRCSPCIRSSVVQDYQWSCLSHYNDYLSPPGSERERTLHDRIVCVLHCPSHQRGESNLSRQCLAKPLRKETNRIRDVRSHHLHENCDRPSEEHFVQVRLEAYLTLPVYHQGQDPIPRYIKASCSGANRRIGIAVTVKVDFVCSLPSYSFFLKKKKNNNKNKSRIPFSIQTLSAYPIPKPLRPGFIPITYSSQQHKQ